MTLNKLVLKLTIVLAMADADETNEKGVLKKLTIKFGQQFNECQGVMNYRPKVRFDFLNYWNDRKLVNYETGCAIICVTHELHLLDPDGNVHIPNTRGFLISAGAEDLMLKSMYDILIECMLTIVPKKIEDICKIALEFAICFRIAIKERKWTPDVTGWMQVESRRIDNNPEIVNYKRSANITDLISVKANSTFDAASFEKSQIYDDLLKYNQTTNYAEDHITAKTNTNLQSISDSKKNTKQENLVANKNETTLPGIKIDTNGENYKKDTIKGTEMKNNTKQIAGTLMI